MKLNCFNRKETVVNKSPHYKVKIVNDGTICVSLGSGHRALLDRVFGITRKKLNAEMNRHQ